MYFPLLANAAPEPKPSIVIDARRVNFVFIFNPQRELPRQYECRVSNRLTKKLLNT